MTPSNPNNARPYSSWIAILLDKLRLTLRVPLPQIDDVHNPLIAHAVSGSPGRARLFKEAHARKRVLLVFGILVLMMSANSAFAQTQRCAIITGGNVGATGVNPAYLANQDGRADEGCTILITLNADGSIRTTHPNPAPSYDNGFDDNIIAVVNNTAQTVSGLQLTSTTTVDIFGFDGDGLCSGPPGWTFSALGPNPNCAIATDPNHYGPLGINFTVFNPFSGIVNFGNGGIPPNGSAFFSLEGADLNKIVVIIDPGLTITKQVSVVGGGAALPGGQLDYLVHVTNASANPATSVVITDDI